MNVALHHPVTSTDGTVLEVGDVVIDPARRRVTHVVVQPPDQHADGRLVPFALLQGSDGADGMLLGCAATELDRFPLVSEISLVGPGDAVQLPRDETMGTTDVVAPPALDPVLGAGWVDDHVTIRWDRIPADEVELRHSSSVFSSDDHRLGSLDGLVCSPDGSFVEVVIRHGILFGRRDVRIPAAHIARIDNDLVVLDVTKQEAARFQAEPLDDWLEQAPSAR